MYYVTNYGTKTTLIYYGEKYGSLIYYGEKYGSLIRREYWEKTMVLLVYKKLWNLIYYGDKRWKSMAIYYVFTLTKIILWYYVKHRNL